MVVSADDRGNIIAGLDPVLVENEDTVIDAMGELRLLGVEVLQRADMVLAGVVGHHVALVDVGAVRGGGGHAGAGIQGAGPDKAILRGDAGDPGGHYLAINLMAGLHIGGDGGLFLVQGLVVVQQGGGLDDSVGIVVLGGQAQLLQRAQHAVGQHAPQLALFNLHAAGQQGLVLGHGHYVALVDVPGTGDDLDGLSLAHVQLADPHVVGIGVVLHLHDAAGHHIFQRVVQNFGDFHLGAGEGHGLRKIAVADRTHIDKLIQPFTGKFHCISS